MSSPVIGSSCAWGGCFCHLDNDKEMNRGEGMCRAGFLRSRRELARNETAMEFLTRSVKQRDQP